MLSKLVSIIIPTFNRIELLKLTIKSIQQQDYKNWECLIIDDGSTDNTQCIVKEIIKFDNRIKYYTNQRTKGAPGARNTGILNATGDYVILFDSDNTMLPNFVTTLVNCLENKKVDVATCYLTIIDKQTENKVGTHSWNSEGNINSKLLNGTTYVDYNCALIKKDLLIKIGLTDENCPSFQEWDTHLRLSKIATYSTVKAELANYYINGADAISSDKKREVIGYLYILNKHKKDWLNYKKAFINFGFAVIELLNEIKDAEFKKSKLKEVYKTVDGLKSAVILQKIKYKILWLRLLKKKVLG